MAEFCLECFNEYMLDEDAEELTEKDVVFDDDLCEGCGEVLPCVVKVKRRAYHKIFGGKPIKWYQFWRGHNPW